MINRKLTGILLLIAGAVLVLYPGSTLYSFCRLIGWCLLISGAVSIFAGLRGKRSPADTASGAACVVAGIVFLSHPGMLIAILPVLAGIAVAGAGAALLIRVLMEKRGGVNATMQLIGGGVTLAVGLILICHPISAVKLLMVIVGVVLVYYGIVMVSAN